MSRSRADRRGAGGGVGVEGALVGGAVRRGRHDARDAIRRRGNGEAAGAGGRRGAGRCGAGGSIALIHASRGVRARGGSQDGADRAGESADAAGAAGHARVIAAGGVRTAPGAVALGLGGDGAAGRAGARRATARAGRRRGGTERAGACRAVALVLAVGRGVRRGGQHEGSGGSRRRCSPRSTRRVRRRWSFPQAVASGPRARCMLHWAWVVMVQPPVGVDAAAQHAGRGRGRAGGAGAGRARAEPRAVIARAARLRADGVQCVATSPAMQHARSVRAA